MQAGSSRQRTTLRCDGARQDRRARALRAVPGGAARRGMTQGRAAGRRAVAAAFQAVFRTAVQSCTGDGVSAVEPVWLATKTPQPPGRQPASPFFAFRMHATSHHTRPSHRGRQHKAVQLQMHAQAGARRMWQHCEHAGHIHSGDRHIVARRVNLPTRSLQGQHAVHVRAKQRVHTQVCCQVCCIVAWRRARARGAVGGGWRHSCSSLHGASHRQLPLQLAAPHSSSTQQQHAARQVCGESAPCCTAQRSPSEAAAAQPTQPAHPALEFT